MPYRSYPKLPGSPDLRITRNRVVVFVHGCFFHGCPAHYRRPHSNQAYWDRKLAANRRRDTEVTTRLRERGWEVVVVWECETSGDTQPVIRRIRSALRLASLNRTSSTHK